MLNFISKKPENYTISDKWAQESNANMEMGMGAGFGPLGYLLTPGAKKLSEVEADRAKRGMRAVEIDPDSGIYTGKYFKILGNKEKALRAAYKKLLGKDWQPSGINWLLRSDEERIRRDIADSINDKLANLSGFRPGDIASIVYPFAYNTATKQVHKWKQIPTHDTFKGFRGLEEPIPKKLDKKAGVEQISLPTGLFGGMASGGTIGFLLANSSPELRKSKIKQLAATIVGGFLGGSLGLWGGVKYAKDWQGRV